MIASVRLGSGSVVLIASAVVLPLCNVLFTQRWLMGPHATGLSPEDIAALVLILCGFVLYKIRSDQEGGGGGDGDAATPAVPVVIDSMMLLTDPTYAGGPASLSGFYTTTTGEEKDAVHNE
jgi:hypothetical protein